MINFIIWCEIGKCQSVNYIMGKHWSKASAVKDLVRDQVIWQVKTLPKFKNPVEIHLFYNSKLDLDNHAFLRKYIIDAMKGYIISEDNPKHVKRIIEEFWNGKGIKVEVTPCNQGKEIGL